MTVNASHASDRKSARESFDERLQGALNDWRAQIGDDRVLTGPSVSGRYGASTVAVAREIPAAVVPRDTSQVAIIVRTANRFGIALYPISTGHNWGYGSANPVCDRCVIVDLSQMNRIQMDEELGLATVEPGVTQQQLRDYLDRNHLRFYVPVHGGGPDCSLIGNALERGYGITPQADHFGALTSLEAVLANGEIYRSALSEVNGEEVDRAFKWGVGPYLDGLFSQGNFGIVTRATIALAAVSESADVFIFSLATDRALEEVVPRVRNVLRSLGTLSSGINLMNARRVVSMTMPYPRDRVPKGNAIPDDVVAELARDFGVSAWTGVGSIYGNRMLIRAARSTIRQELRGCVSRLLFFSEKRVRHAIRLARLVPGGVGRRLGLYAKAVEEFRQITTGVPKRMALPLAYWKLGQNPDTSRPIDPAADGCGLIWYAPLIPARPGRVQEYVDLVNKTCLKHGMEPLITLTSLSDRLFDSTVPILFDQRDADESRRAQACYLELYRLGREHGFLPYRVGVQHMDKVVQPQAPCWQLAATLKKAADPGNIIAPGRYAPLSWGDDELRLERTDVDAKPASV